MASVRQWEQGSQGLLEPFEVEAAVRKMGAASGHIENHGF